MLEDHFAGEVVGSDRSTVPVFLDKCGNGGELTWYGR